MLRNSYAARLVLLPIPALAVVSVLLAQGRGERPAFQGDSITAARPLSYIADSLEARYGKPVTYEDPVWQWQGDFVPMPDLPILNIRQRTATMPPELNPTAAPTLDAAAVGKALAEYDKANDAPHYRVLQSSYGLHIVSATVRDAGGNLVQAKNPLDAVVSIPVAERSAAGHLAAICAAASQVAGIEIECSVVGFFGDWYERLFAAPGGALVWGTGPVGARAAVIDLFSHSATTFTWRLNCALDPRSSGLNCVLNIERLQVATGDRSRILVSKGYRAATQPIEYDRCPDCRPAPKK